MIKVNLYNGLFNVQTAITISLPSGKIDGYSFYTSIINVNPRNANGIERT